jgi:MFS family permease
MQSTPSGEPSRKPSAADGPQNTKYEFKVVSLMTIGLGLVGLDRFIINPLFPVMQKDLGLNYQDMGLIAAALALACGCASIFAGGLSDRIGRKRVLVPALLAFSVLVATSGLASGLVSLLVIRALMGLADGAYMPAAVVSVVAASKPSRIGLNTGIQQMAQPLFGLGLGPLVAVGLLNVLPSWHWVFAVVAIPGLVVSLMIAKMLRNDVPPARLSPSQPPRVRAVLRYPAVIVNALCMVCYLSCVITLAAFLPSYLTDHLHMSLDQMGLVMAGQGVGSLVGMVVIPAISDRLGYKPVLLAALAVNAIALSLFPFIGSDAVALFAILFVATGTASGAIAINLGPLTRAAAPAALATSATGFVVGAGEIIGGALAPAFAGALAQRFGITVIPQIALIAIVVALVLVKFGVRAPRSASSEAPATANTTG